MRIYLDICCLKRPFDDQTQPRIRVETEAVLAILRSWSDGKLDLLRSDAHDVENELNSNPQRAAIVQDLLTRFEASEPATDHLRQRVQALEVDGLRSYDALHLAWAEHLSADAFATTDDRLLRKAASLARPPLRVENPVQLIEDLP